MRINRRDLFNLILFLALLFVFYSRFFPPMEHSFANDAPTATKASDANFHVAWAESFKTTGRYSPRAPYLAGGVKNMIESQPPGLPISTAIFSMLTGIETFNTIIFVATLIYVGIVLGFYLLIKEHYSNEAGLLYTVLASLPLLGENGIPSLFHYPTLIGFFHMYAGVLFVPFAGLFFKRFLDGKRVTDAIAFGLMMGGMFLFHTPEVQMLVPFLAVYGLYSFLRDRDTRLLKVGTYALLAALLVSLTYLPNLYFARVLTPSGEVSSEASIQWFQPQAAPHGMFYVLSHNNIPPVYLGMFALGAVLALALKKYRNYLTLFLLYLFLYTYSNWIGVYIWAHRLRFIWPFVMPVFMALLLAELASLLKKRVMRLPWTAMLSFLLLVFVVFTVPLKGTGGPIMAPEEGEAIFWIRDNTPEGSRVMHFNHYYQGKSLYTNRINFEAVGALDYINEGRLGFEYSGYFEGNMFEMPYWTGFLQVGYHRNDTFPNGGYSVCDMDYLLLNYNLSGDVLEQYDRALIQHLTQRNWRVAFDNGKVAVIERGDGPCP